ncbi:MAG: carbamoyl-phosphate synthase large subunit [Coriobacteriales bacterium]|nr:carbamoyl-phosphate synthase large subunit [Coriobacteriales bacterium]
MPRRNDIKKILIIGSGPIVIGQACEFDYSGAQACKVLAQDGYEVVLVNSNPATIMTDPPMATRTYIEPITKASLTRIIAKERPDVLLPTLGGQTALNAAVELAEGGILDEYGVEMLGCKLDVIQRGEDRKLFAECMSEIGLECARSGYAYSVDDAVKLAEGLGYPVVLRPSYTLGGAGGGFAENEAQLRETVAQGLDLSPAGEVLVEESIAGWKEYEMEVMRDHKGNGIIICSIENFDAMGVHTGDSITVAPAQTLSDIEYQRMRVASLAILEKIGVETGGSNVQFAINPADGRMVVIEMNPRVSRSSALASKATGFPIAKFAAKLAVGYTLDEIENDITKTTPAAFEPAIDYCVVKIPRFTFEKFEGTDAVLTTRMKSVGEVMAIGRSFKEALNKACRSLETGHVGLGADTAFERSCADLSEQDFAKGVALPTEMRLYYMAEALRRGWTVAEVHEASQVDPWFLGQMAEIVAFEQHLQAEAADLDDDSLAEPLLRQAKQLGLSDPQIANLCAKAETEVRALRKRLGVLPVFKMVDTCAAEFASNTAYYYKCYDAETDVAPSARQKVMILGAGPNRIGQGIEFDYCCVQAALTLREAGFETIMVNCNPETVSTDYDTSDRLYFEPLTFEDVMDICDLENADGKLAGVIVTLGGQTPLKLADALKEAGVPILGTQPDAIDLAEDRERFAALLDRLGVAYPAAGVASSTEQAVTVAKQLGYPLRVRPSYVLGGRGMVIAYNDDFLTKHLRTAARVTPDHPVYLDSFLEDAIECDVDALCDGKEVYIGGILEHIEEAGIHSGDSACATPPFTLSAAIQEAIRKTTRQLAINLDVRGLLNVQYAVKDAKLFVIEANPRASRTVPFTSKATGVPLARIAARVMAGASLADFALPADDRALEHFAVKEAVMPFGRFPGAQIFLGPEMKSTGEVMGVAQSFPAAYAKAQLAIDTQLPTSGTAFISVADDEKRAMVALAAELVTLGFDIVATAGTLQVLKAFDIPARLARKVSEGEGNIVDAIHDGEIQLIVNIPAGGSSRGDSYRISAAAVRYSICYATTLNGANAIAGAIALLQRAASAPELLAPVALQDLPQMTV